MEHEDMGSVSFSQTGYYRPHPCPSPTREGSGCAFVRDMS